MPLPGKPICPATSERFSSAWALWIPFVCWVMPMPQTRHEPAKAGFAYQRAARAMSSAGTPATRAASSRVKRASEARQASNPSVRAWTNSSFARPSSRITRAIALKSATSVPGRGWIQRSAWSHSSTRRGFTTTSRAPRPTARRKRTAITGWFAEASAPTTRRQPASS